jgi:hypothetical protein
MKPNKLSLKISTSIQSNLKNIVATGFVIWLIPFLVSIPFFNSNKELVVNFYVFSFAMFVLLSVLTWIGYKRLDKANFFYRNQNAIKVSMILVAIQIILDMLILVGAFGTKIDVWAATVLPVYLIIPAIFIFRSKQSTLQA